MSTTGLSHSLLRAARDAAPALSRLRDQCESRRLVAPKPGEGGSSQSEGGSPTSVAWLYLAATARPHGLLKQLCLEHGTDYDSTRAAIQHLRQHHCVL